MTQVQEAQATTAQKLLHHRVVVVGGGNGGISVAAQLLRKSKGLDVAIIEPSDKHYYQPLWTLVGGGDAKREATVHSEASVIPKGATWIRDAVTTFCPDENALVTAGGTKVSYDYLVVAPGMQLNWGAVKGLPEAIGKDGVCSNYSYDYVDKTWEFISNFKGGTAIFTHPATPIKCGGAPQKIAYLADDAFRKQGVREKSTIIFATANAGIFQVEKYAKTLRKVIDRKGIDARYRTNLVEVRPATREAVLVNLDTNEETIVKYDLLHVTPPQSAPDFIRNSPLANADGWVDVNKNTLQHTKYPNVFSLGDASSLPTSKTGAAVRKQAPALVKNLLALIESKPLSASYDGYTACPLVTGYGKLVMAEFDYDLTPKESFKIDQSKERRTMYWVKKYGLPRLYWSMIMKGRA
ncbi:MAG: NAD(P)/FAD-dependent oxidoreductase [Thermoflexaceae bacterium]|nr:NAD(P)/FAD-dependent oxidoreductase [Thermoflexaceae bacterium]